jgi:hypothetical protein
MKLAIFMVLTFLAAAINLGCENATLPPIFHKISEIKANPTNWEGKTVRLQGKVLGMVATPLSSVKAYELEDASGTVYVVSNQGLPAKGEQVKVLGKVQNLVIFGTFSLGLAVLEVQRL